MNRTIGIGLTAVALLTAHPATSRGDDPPDKRPETGKTFTGSIQVPANQREAVMKLLNDRGFRGAYVPEDAAPETLLYRGPKAEYEAASEIVARLRWDNTPQQKPKADGKPKLGDEEQPKPKENPDRVALDKLGLSPLQKELCEEMFKASERRLAEFPDQSRDEDVMRKGAEFNRWKRGTLRAILTRNQYSGYFSAFGARATDADLGPAVKLPPVDPNAPKTDDAIFARLGLSVKQKEHLDLHLAWKEKATAEMKQQPGGHVEAGDKISDKWRAGLDRILTKDQRKQYSDYWGPPPANQLR